MKPPRVGEMLPHLRRCPDVDELMAAESPTQLRVIAGRFEDETAPTRMLALMLSTMTPGQRKLVKARLRS